MEKETSARSVESVEGTRKTDFSKFHGLKFKGPRHADFFLTPGQLKTVLALQDEAVRIARTLPKLPRRLRQESGERSGSKE